MGKAVGAQLRRWTWGAGSGAEEPGAEQRGAQETSGLAPRWPGVQEGWGEREVAMAIKGQREGSSLWALGLDCVSVRSWPCPEHTASLGIISHSCECTMNSELKVWFKKEEENL